MPVGKIARTSPAWGGSAPPRIEGRSVPPARPAPVSGFRSVMTGPCPCELASCGVEGITCRTVREILVITSRHGARRRVPVAGSRRIRVLPVATHRRARKATPDRGQLDSVMHGQRCRVELVEPPAAEKPHRSAANDQGPAGGQATATGTRPVPITTRATRSPACAARDGPRQHGVDDPTRLRSQLRRCPGQQDPAQHSHDGQSRSRGSSRRSRAR